MPRMREFSFLYTLLQPTKSRGITQSAECLHLFGGDIVMFLKDLSVVPREKAHTGAAAREQPQDSPVIAR